MFVYLSLPIRTRQDEASSFLQYLQPLAIRHCKPMVSAKTCISHKNLYIIRHLFNSKKNSTLQEKHTLNSIARCLQRPIESLPMGSAIDPRCFLRSSLYFFHNGCNSFSPAEATSLVKERNFVYKIV